MRVPKFKAWDKETSSLRNVLVIDWLNGLVDLSGGITEREFDDVVLVQSTGLKDKNGTEIYEGDICEYEDGEYPFIAIVEPDYVNWYLKGISPKDNFNINGFQDCGKSWLKVIGNAFENPELLEVHHE